ncbi:MAG: hypothetical protein ABI240_04650 [Sphingomonas sp.]
MMNATAAQTCFFRCMSPPVAKYGIIIEWPQLGACGPAAFQSATFSIDAGPKHGMCTTRSGQLRIFRIASVADHQVLAKGSGA